MSCHRHEAQGKHGRSPRAQATASRRSNPSCPRFQLEEYLARIDRELVDVSGLNDLLRGIAPARVLSSSKAINALVANYEARIRIKRDLFFRWRTQDMGHGRAHLGQ